MQMMPDGRKCCQLSCTLHESGNTMRLGCSAHQDLLEGSWDRRQRSSDMLKMW